LSLTTDRSSYVRLQKDITSLIQKETAEAKKITVAEKKNSQAQISASKATSLSQQKSYLKSAENASSTANKARAEQQKYMSARAKKIQEASKLAERISKAEEKDQKAKFAATSKQMKDDDQRKKDEAKRQGKADLAARKVSDALQQKVADLEKQVADQLNAVTSVPMGPKVLRDEIEYDMFISHAWEDKEDFVHDLASKASASGLKVWYDKSALTWGDSLRQSIDDGLRRSYFGVAVLSPSFFKKSWTNYELDGMIERALDGSGRLLPIWHHLSKDDIMRHAPSLANRLALNTASLSVDDIVVEMVKMRDAYSQ
jgi:hypothetical protein